MSADLLREATGLMRATQTPETGTADFFTAVADWLDACALVLDAAPNTAKAHAERVARAYLHLDGTA